MQKRQLDFFGLPTIYYPQIVSEEQYRFVHQHMWDTKEGEDEGNNF